jgi:hypothetical protein
MKAFQVLVGNVGHVYDGNNYMQAQCTYSAYVKQSKSGTYHSPLNRSPT